MGGPGCWVRPFVFKSKVCKSKVCGKSGRLIPVLRVFGRIGRIQPVPGFLNSRRMKLLYLLALFQLVAGPLVIFQVTVLCKLTVKEVRQQGAGAAFVKALHGEDFQATIRNSMDLAKKDARSPLPTSDPKGKIPDLKFNAPLWRVFAAIAPPCIGRTACKDWARRWTPVWPQAPPGPPPRIG